jgi:hypothetical protein
LASSRISSNAPDWQDVAANLIAFEAMNNVRLEMRVSTADDHGLADLLVTVAAHERTVEIGDQPSLGSVSVKCSGTRLKSLEACTIHALYLLDSKLARLELEGSIKKR